ncbi:DUF669 domain-containing protein [Sulfidibacter corallicola]|uniref:DUF669 domain-containing protein n=1 Tax=Sulfidibacter corallicola TaxID=2818388 RepID=A0A8A4TK94_SULCO|nr:DUF669 domain-containing protein [Sulfidibacter corallicola]QTD49624.1 DUF669 domain-containing protein [Sulfidibacter corallicola]
MTMEDNFENEIDLSSMDDDFVRAEKKESKSFEDLPEGKYQVRVAKVELTKAKTTGNPMIKWELLVLSGKYRNRRIWRNSVLTANTMSYIKTDLAICGLELAKLSDLPLRLADLLDVDLEIFLKVKADSTNVYFNKRLEGLDTAADSAPTGKDDIPF